MKRSHSQLPLFILEARSRVLGGGRQLYVILLLMAAVASLSGFFLTHPIHPSASAGGGAGLARRQIDLPGMGGGGLDVCVCAAERRGEL
jgi:hypothetical protein